MYVPTRDSPSSLFFVHLFVLSFYCGMRTCDRIFVVIQPTCPHLNFELLRDRITSQSQLFVDLCCLSNCDAVFSTTVQLAFAS